MKQIGLFSLTAIAFLGTPPAFGQCTITAPTAAAGASISTPGALAVNPSGKLYIATGNCVLQFDPQTGMLTRVAGGATAGYSGDGGAASLAQFNAPGGLASDTAGNLFIADTGNHAVRKMTLDGNISTIAGSGLPGYSGDNGPAALAVFNGPQGLAADPFGTLYIADTNNNAVRKISASGVITTYAGNGTAGYTYDGFFSRQSELNAPVGLAVSSGNLYIGDSANNRVRLVTAARLITTLAGTGTAGYSGDDGDGGQDEDAELNAPTFLASDRLGINIFISDSANNCIRQVLPNTIITTIAGGTKGTMGKPAGIALDASGNLYLSDATNSRVLKLTAGSGLTTVVGK
jgi:sugar lactone lactonase YvrE